MTWQFRILHRFTRHPLSFHSPYRLLQSTLHWLHFKTENRGLCYICRPAKRLLPRTRELCCCAPLLAQSGTGNSICAKNKKHHQHSEKKEVCHSHCVCVCRVRELQPTPIYTTHKHSAHTGFYHMSTFPRSSPLPVMCVPSQGLSLTLSWSHVCHFQDCSGWFLSSLLFPGCHKVKRDAYPHQQLSASLYRLV